MTISSPACDLALFEHAEVEAGAAVGDQQRRNARIVHANPHAVTGHAGLGDLEEGRADLVAVADADLVVAQPFDREVLAELAVDEVVAGELVLPVAVGVDLVDEDGSVLAAVPGEIALAVAVHVEPAYAARAADGVLEDACEHGLPLPRHLLGHADVDRQQPPAHRPGAVQRSAGPPASSMPRLRSMPWRRHVLPRLELLVVQGDLALVGFEGDQVADRRHLVERRAIRPGSVKDAIDVVVGGDALAAT